MDLLHALKRFTMCQMCPCVCGINTSACGFVHTAQLVRGPLFERACELCATAADATADAVFGGRQVGNVPVLRGPWPCGGGRAILRRWYYYYYYIIIISYIAAAASVSSVVACYPIQVRGDGDDKTGKRTATRPPSHALFG